MSEIITKLRQDHARMSRLLRYMENEVADPVAGIAPNYELLLAILEYASSYADWVHHPVENAIQECLIEKAPKTAETIGDLVYEHRHLAALNHLLRSTIATAMAEPKSPPESLAAVVRDYVDASRKHIRMEETLFFPAALAALDDEDWRQIVRAEPRAAEPLVSSGTSGLDVVANAIKARETSTAV